MKANVPIIRTHAPFVAERLIKLFGATIEQHSLVVDIAQGKSLARSFPLLEGERTGIVPVNRAPIVEFESPLAADDTLDDRYSSTDFVVFHVKHCP